MRLSRRDRNEIVGCCMKRIALSSVLVLGLGLGVGPALAQIDRAAAMRASASMVKIEVQRVQGGFSLGSGVMVAAGKVVTNCHVTRDAVAAHVLRDGGRWLVDGQAVDAERDLCVLRVPGLAAGTTAGVAPLGRSADLRIGESVMALGYTGGLGMQHTEGRVVGLHRYDGGRVVQSDNAFSSGASGGGLFDAQLRLVGILTFRLRGGMAHYFSSPVEWLQPLLDAADDYRVVAPSGVAQKAYWEQPAALQPPFLRAEVLEREARWDELEGLAFNWTRVDADNPRPWYLQGVALHSLKRWPESQRALERCVQIEPGSAEAWFRLGVVHADLGQIDSARLARSRLEALQSERAAELGRLIELY